MGETAEAIALSERLLDEGVFVTGFGFPVVPEGTARVRVQMSAALEPEHLDRAIDGIPPRSPLDQTGRDSGHVQGIWRDRNPRVMRISICAYLERGTRSQVTRDECAAMKNWPVNLIGLGLLVAGVLFMYFLNFVGIIIGMILIIGGIVALWMTYRRKKYPATGASSQRPAALGRAVAVDFGLGLCFDGTSSAGRRTAGGGGLGREHSAIADQDRVPAEALERRGHGSTYRTFRRLEVKRPAEERTKRPGRW